MIDIHDLRVERGTFQCVIDSQILRKSDIRPANQACNLDLQARSKLYRIEQEKKQLKLIQKTCTSTPGLLVKEDLTRRKALIKLLGVELENIREDLDENLGKIGNYVDIKSSCSVMERLAQKTLKPQLGCSDLDQIEWKSLCNSFLDEKMQLPILCRTSKEELRVICQGDKCYSTQATYLVVEQFISRMPSLRVVEVPPENLPLHSTMSFQLMDSNTCLFQVSNSTDFLCRAAGIRSGHKKQLQDSAKYAHSVSLHVFESNSIDISILPTKNQLMQPWAEDIESVDQVKILEIANGGKLSLRGVESLELWLRKHSYVAKYEKTELDLLMLQRLQELEFEIYSVQFPCISRWQRSL